MDKYDLSGGVPRLVSGDGETAELELIDALEMKGGALANGFFEQLARRRATCLHTSTPLHRLPMDEASMAKR